MASFSVLFRVSPQQFILLHHQGYEVLKCRNIPGSSWWVPKARCSGKSLSVSSMKMDGESSGIALSERSSLHFFNTMSSSNPFSLLFPQDNALGWHPPILPNSASTGSISFRDLTGETACQQQDSDTPEPPVQSHPDLIPTPSTYPASSDS